MAIRKEKYETITEEDFLKEISNIELQETTTTGSVGGSFETPLGFVNRRKKTKTESRKMNITIPLIESLVRATLISEEVYKKTGKDKTAKEKAYSGATKNAKPTKNDKSDAMVNTKKSTDETGKIAKEANKKSRDKVSDSFKSNLTDGVVVDVNADKLQDEDQRIEAYANGMQDLQYDSITPSKQAKNIEYIRNKASMGDPSLDDTGGRKQFIDDAKKRNSARDSDDDYYRFFGSTPVAKAVGDDGKTDKHIAYENTIKKLTFKKLFENDKDMTNRIKKLPNKYKNNNTIFEMYDGVTNYKVRWEGHGNKGVAVILEQKNSEHDKASYERHMRLSKYNTQDSNTKTPAKVHDTFIKMMNESRSIFTQD